MRDAVGSYWWPGNIRELENLIERARRDRATGEWITDEDLPFEFHVAELDRDAPRTRACSIARW